MTSHARVVSLGLLDGALVVRGGYERAMKGIVRGVFVKLLGLQSLLESSNPIWGQFWKIPTQFQPAKKASLAPFAQPCREEYLRRHRNLDLYIVALPHSLVRARLVTCSALGIDGQFEMKVDDVQVAKSGSVHHSRGGDFLSGNLAARVEC